jgi:hypothetical protein
MSMTDPVWYENKRVWLIIGGLAFVLLASALYITDCGSNWSFRRGVSKDKQEIANKTNSDRE